VIRGDRFSLFPLAIDVRERWQEPLLVESARRAVVDATF
jgi:hypothetical protein